MEEVSKYIQMVLIIKVIGKIIKPKEKVNLFIQKEINI